MAGERDDGIVDRLKRAGLITNGTYGPILDPDRIVALLDLHTDRLARAMALAYTSVGTWNDFPDAVGAFAEATVREYVALREDRPT